MRVVALWRYPVKSMAGEALDRTVVDIKIPGDREWGVFDASTGKLLSAKSVPALLAARARFDGDTTAIELPDGTIVIAGSLDGDRAIGEWLGRAVVLRRAAEKASIERRRGGGGDPDGSAGGAGAAAPAVIDCELDDGTGEGPQGLDTFETPANSLFDSRSTLHLISSATLDALDRDHVAGAGDHRRYRPNIIVDGATAYEEDDWVGRDVAIGGLAASVRKRTGRCVMVSRAQPDVAADRGLLRYLVAARGNQLGVYLDPRGSAAIAVGDDAVVSPV